MATPQLTQGMTDEQIRAFVQQLLSHLALDEKISLMSGWRGNMLRLAASLILFRQITRRPMPAAGLRRAGIPPIRFSDGPRGMVTGHGTCFPVAMARGASWDPGLEERIGEAIGREIRAMGGNYFGGVCVNLLRHPAWGRAQETYGEDPTLLGEMGAALVRGVQRHNVMACVKHYALNSIEKCRFRVDVHADERTLREVYLPHFRRCVEEGAASVMGAYNKFRGEFCCQNRYLLTDILRREWGFDGFVSSDWVRGVRDTVAAALAGLDVEMPAPRFYGRRLKRAVDEGLVPEEIIDRSAAAILRKVAQFSTAEDPQRYDRSLIGCPAHVALAREAAEASMVLLKNQGGVLPLDPAKVQGLAVIGRLAAVANTGDHGSSRVHPPYTVTPLQGLRRCLEGCGSVAYADGSNLDEALGVASAADAVVVVAGYDYRDEGEYVAPHWPNGHDRSSLSLHDEEIDLIRAVSAANAHCIVVLVGGSAVMMEEWKESVPAILMAWYAGQEGGHALARILFGDVCPSGKLPFTIPSDANDLPFFDPEADEIEYDFYHGYTLCDKNGSQAAFPLGYGLSYTSFAYSNLRLSTTEISPDGELVASVDLRNTGDRAGAEVVQLYVGYVGSHVERHVKDLKGFQRVHLAPGESKTVRLPLRAQQLAYYDVAKSAWAVEPITYRVLVGSSSSAEDLQEARFRVMTAV